MAFKSISLGVSAFVLSTSTNAVTAVHEHFDTDK